MEETLLTSARTALGATERVEAAAVALRRAAGKLRTERPGEAPLGASPLPLLGGVGCLLVQRRGDGCRATALGQAGDDDRPALVAQGDVEPVTDDDVARRLHDRAVHPNMTCRDGLGGVAPRLAEARRPDPLVDPHGFHRPSLAVPGRARAASPQPGGATRSTVSATRRARVSGRFASSIHSTYSRWWVNDSRANDVSAPAAASASARSTGTSIVRGSVSSSMATSTRSGASTPVAAFTERLTATWPTPL